MTYEDDEDQPSLDPIAQAMLDVLTYEGALTVEQMAKVIAEQRRKPKDSPQLWRKYMQAVKQQAMFLGKTGHIDVVHKGEVVEPDNFKGRVHLRLKTK